MLRFEKITPDNYRECTNLKVSDGQVRCVATNAKSLAEAYAYYDTSLPYAIYDDDVMIGFVLLRELPDLKCYYISQFMIDQRFQGRGYGLRATQLLIDTLRTEGKYPRIDICFSEGNVPAEKLYLKTGFTHTGEFDGPDVLMSLDLV